MKSQSGFGSLLQVPRQNRGGYVSSVVVVLTVSGGGRIPRPLC
jgi:hypothetical protein